MQTNRKSTKHSMFVRFILVNLSVGSRVRVASTIGLIRLGQAVKQWIDDFECQILGCNMKISRVGNSGKTSKCNSEWAGFVSINMYLSVLSNTHYETPTFSPCGRFSWDQQIMGSEETIPTIDTFIGWQIGTCTKPRALHVDAGMEVWPKQQVQMQGYMNWQKGDLGWLLHSQYNYRYSVWKWCFLFIFRGAVMLEAETHMLHNLAVFRELYYFSLGGVLEV